ncbi:uncharacterized protein LOC107267665 [Cephus cinctus]|uniref:Uncharacterized protein LOC107267665 n=1 Tax=Cephus cinctus TaxID=211228 RepID=A0AAJ7FJN7_CEPCN|nr:uncharacterized protein LOC107267665 [Cephus cinctus]
MTTNGSTTVPHTCSCPINREENNNAENPPALASPQYENNDTKIEVDLPTSDTEIANVQIIAANEEIEVDGSHDFIFTKIPVLTVSNPLLQQSLIENVQMDLVNFGGILVSKKALQSCHQTKISKLTTDLMTVVFSATEMAESSLTGKIAKMHKERNKSGEVRQKKELDPSKIQAIIGHVQERIQGATEAEIKKALRGKLKYESQKQYGVGYKKVQNC